MLVPTRMDLKTILEWMKTAKSSKVSMSSDLRGRVRVTVYIKFK